MSDTAVLPLDSAAAPAAAHPDSPDDSDSAAAPAAAHPDSPDDSDSDGESLTFGIQPYVPGVFPSPSKWGPV